MSYRKVSFVNGETYHIFNRGVDKRNIFLDKYDLERFFISILLFNSINLSGSVFEMFYELELIQETQLGSEAPKLEKLMDFYNNNSENHLVEFVCYCLNPNHFHFVLEQKVDNGISKFMQRMGGYTSYFNKKYKRNGSLFANVFKAVHVSDNTQLLHLSVYVNLNNQLGSLAPKLSKSSWREYVEECVVENLNLNKGNKIKKEEGICKKDIVLNQFGSKEKYKEFASSGLEDILKRKINEKEYENLLIE